MARVIIKDKAAAFRQIDSMAETCMLTQPAANTIVSLEELV